MNRFALIAATGLLLGTAHAAPMRMSAMTATKMDNPKTLPKESGQSAFAAIHEIVTMLEADPKTDWSKVNIDALRQHLADMDAVTLHARITYTPIANGEHIHVSGTGELRDAIQRMIGMHVAMAGDTADWHMTEMNAPDGAHINVVAKSPRGLQRMKALGLIGMMAEGEHHQPHHMMMAAGKM